MDDSSKERPKWCPHKDDCTNRAAYSDKCVGQLPEEVDYKTHRLCFKKDTLETYQVFDWLINSLEATTQFEWLFNAICRDTQRDRNK